MSSSAPTPDVHDAAAAPDDAAPLTPAPRPVLTAAQSRRARQPWIAMVLSVLAVLGVVAVVASLSPEPAAPPRQDRVDVAAAAATVPEGPGLPALAPAVPEAWTSSYARVASLDGVPTWDVGWVVSESVFAGLRQTDRADPTWLSLRVGAAPAVGTVDVDGITWRHFTPQGSDEQHLVAEVDGSTLVLTATGDRAALEDLARAVAQETR